MKQTLKEIKYALKLNAEANNRLEFYALRAGQNKGKKRTNLSMRKLEELDRYVKNSTKWLDSAVERLEILIDGGRPS